MKKILSIFMFMVSALLIMFSSMTTVHASSVQQVQLRPTWGPIQIKAGDSLTFTRTNNPYNNITYTERFTHANQFGTNPFWGFSTSSDGHRVHYNGTSLRLEGGTWSSHAFNAPYFDEWVTWTYEGNVGTLTFLKDWPYEVKNLFRNTLPTEPQSGWFNTTSIATYAVLNIHTVAGNIPGESTTPPTGVTLSGSTFANMIYFNDATNNLLTSNPSVYISTTIGNTFDTNILTDNLVFVVNQPNIRLYIGHTNGGDDNLSGIGDYVIYKDATYIYIKKLVNDIEVDEIYISLSDFAFLMIETIPDTNPQTWTVTFNANGGSLVTSQTINHNELAVEPDNPTRTGYTFEGWLLNDIPFDFTTSITQNITLVAHWLSEDPNLVSISFNSNGGTSVQTVQIESGTTLNELSTSTRPGYIFMGWYTDAGLTQMFTVSTVLDNDLTLYAKWLPLSGGGEPIIDDGSNTYNWVYIVVAGLLVSALFIKPKSKKGNGR